MFSIQILYEIKVDTCKRMKLIRLILNARPLEEDIVRGETFDERNKMGREIQCTSL
jgi:hypothetical protein